MATDGGPAFPRGHDTGSDGMSLRDWFAGQALIYTASRYNIDLGYARMELAAKDAYGVADAMLKAREVSDASSKEGGSRCR